MLSTLRHAFRGVRSAPGLGIAAMLCIAIGTAATTCIATLISATLLRPVPFPEGERLTRIWLEEPGKDARIGFSIPEIADFARLNSFDAYAATARSRIGARFSHGTHRMRGEGVTPGYFEMLGINAELGRTLNASDHAAGAAPAVVLSHATWMRHYGGDPGVIGKELRTENTTYTVVGVTPAKFQGTVEDDIVEFFVPLQHYQPQSLLTNRASRPVWVIGRLAPGRSIEAAQSEAAGILSGLAQTYPDIYRNRRIHMEPLGENWREGMRGGSRILFAAAALLLAIAAINVGGLLLARVLNRWRELALRSALGADSRTLTTQLFLESAVIALGGGIIGMLAGPYLLDGFLAISPPERFTLPSYVTLSVDSLTLLITAGTLVVAAMIAGTVPALFARNVAPADVLRQGGRGTVGSGFEKRWGRVLIAGEVALTLVLLVAGGLLVRTYGELSSADLGYERERLIRLAVTLSRADYGTPEQLPAVYKRLHDELAAVPGARRIGLVHPTLPPYDGQRMRIRLQGVEMPELPDGLEVGAHLADENLLPMFGARMVAGRNLQLSDATAEETAVVISATLAELMGGAEQAIGKTINFTDPNDMPSGDARVVGVVENIAYEGLTSDLRQMAGASASPRERHDVYVPLARFPQTIVSIGAWTSGDPAAVIGPLRRKIVEIAPLSPVHWDATMAEEIAAEYAPTRFYLVMVAAFSVSALLLTSIGLYALLSQAATRRTGEMGLRIALGATPAAVMRLLLSAGLLPLAGGVAVGLGLSAYVAYAMKSLLFGVGSFDAVTFGVAVAVLLAVTLAAGFVPARRVAAVDPMVALREE